MPGVRQTRHSGAPRLALMFALVSCAPARPAAIAAPSTVAEPVVIDPPVAPAAAPPEQVAAKPWPEECPPLAGASVVAVARISANVGDSPPGATYIVVRGELQATFAAWREAATAQGFVVLAEQGSERVRAASLIDGAGVRAYILLQRSDGDELAGMFNRGRREPIRLGGPCITPATRTRAFDVERSAIVQDGGYRRERGIEQHETQFGHDFDADGELDLLVPTTAPAACPRDLTWTVYLGRGGCFHEVGTVGPGGLSFEGDGGVATGPRPLVFRSQATELGDGGTISTTVRTTFVFKDARYVRGAREQVRGICYHCPVEICRPPPG